MMTLFTTRRGANAALLAFFGAVAIGAPAMAQQARDPGAEAFVQTGDRTVISYLMKPLHDQLMRAFREK